LCPYRRLLTCFHRGWIEPGDIRNCRVCETLSPTMITGRSGERSANGVWLRSPQPTAMPAFEKAWYSGSLMNSVGFVGTTIYTPDHVSPIRGCPLCTSTPAILQRHPIWAANLVDSKSAAQVTVTAETTPFNSKSCSTCSLAKERGASCNSAFRGPAHSLQLDAQFASVATLKAAANNAFDRRVNSLWSHYPEPKATS